jgi:SAM-dependent methyltransferase
MKPKDFQNKNRILRILRMLGKNPLSFLKRLFHFIFYFAIEISKFIRGYIFDKCYHIKTSGDVEISDLVLSSPKNSLKGAHKYQPIALSHLDKIFNFLKDKHNFHFIDIGCGKGRVCFYAALHDKKITGIDFSESLINLANANLKKFSNPNQAEINFYVADARSYLLPDEKCMVFLFNPFNDIILKDFLEINKNHFLKYNSEIIYHNDVYKNVFDDMGFKTNLRCSIKPVFCSFYSYSTSDIL